MTDSMKALLAAVDRHIADLTSYGASYMVADLKAAADKVRPLIEGEQ